MTTLILLLVGCGDPDQTLAEMYVTVGASSLDDSIEVRLHPNSFAGVASADCRALVRAGAALDGVAMDVDEPLIDDDDDRVGLTGCSGGWWLDDVQADGVSAVDAQLSLGRDFVMGLGPIRQDLSVQLIAPADGVLVAGGLVTLALEAQEGVRVSWVGVGPQPRPGLDARDWERLAQSADAELDQDGLVLDFRMPTALPGKDFGTWLVVQAQSTSDGDCPALSCQVTGHHYAGVTVDW